MRKKNKANYILCLYCYFCIGLHFLYKIKKFYFIDDFVNNYNDPEKYLRYSISTEYEIELNV